MLSANIFMPDLSASELQVAIGKLKTYKSPAADQIPAEMFQARGETLCSEIHKLIKFIWDKKECPHQWKQSIVVPIHKKAENIDCINYRGI
jgi:hypothetical protein